MTAYRYYTAVTLDGFLADEHDSLDWLFRQQIDENGAGNTAEFLTGIGAQVMGATTYSWVLEHQRDWLPELPTFVFTHRELEKVSDHVVLLSGAPSEHRELLEAAAGERDVWIQGGGGLAAAFARDGMLDEVTVSIAPVMLGSGKPLFPGSIDLELQECARNHDFVVARYTVTEPGGPAARR